jgi:hypothetical protein
MAQKSLLILENWMTPRNLRLKRAAAGIPGNIVCRVVGIARSRLSGIELRIRHCFCRGAAAYRQRQEQNIRSRQQLVKLATEAGLSPIGVRL